MALATKSVRILNIVTVTAHIAAVVHQSVNEFCLVVCTMNSVDLRFSIDSFKAPGLSDPHGERAVDAIL